MMRVVVNGSPEELDDGMTLDGLVARHNLTPTRVAVEVNKELITRREYASTTLHDGDRIEIVTFVGGG